jgi:hypothetical protein
VRSRGAWSGILALSLMCAAVMWCSPASADQKSPTKKLFQRTRSIMLGNKPRVRPGDWVQYRMSLTPPKGTGIPKWEMLVKLSYPIHADLERPLDKKQHWMELEFTDSVGSEEGMLVVLKMLVEGDPRDKKSIKRAFFCAGKRTPMEIPSKYLEESEKWEVACGQGDKKGCAAEGGKVRRFPAKKVYTKMGWIRATRVLTTYPRGGGTAEFWASGEIPVFGLVRANIEGGIAMEMELESFGKGALSKLDEQKAVLMPDPKELEQLLKNLK